MIQTSTSSRRRSRFTAYLRRPGSTAVEPRVILAYEAASVRAHYERMGYIVSGVERGDYRAKSRPAKPTRPTGAWRLDERALREAIALLGIKLPVEVKQTGHQGGRYGAHSLRPYGGSVRIANGKCYNADTATGIKHHITVKSWLTPDEAGRTLWHELAHAAQSEDVMNRLPDSATIRDCLRTWHTTYRDGVAYSRKPYEVDARQHENLNDDLPLAR